MIGTKRWIAASGLLACAAFCPGCGTTGHLSAESTSRPSDIDSEYSEYFDIFNVVVVGEKRRDERVGQLQRQVKGDEEYLWVKDLRLHEVGLLYKGIAFKIEETVLPDGSSQFKRTELGDYGLLGGIQRILGLEEGSVRTQKIVAGKNLP